MARTFLNVTRYILSKAPSPCIFIATHLSVKYTEWNLRNIPNLCTYINEANFYQQLIVTAFKVILLRTIWLCRVNCCFTYACMYLCCTLYIFFLVVGMQKFHLRLAILTILLASCMATRGSKRKQKKDTGLFSPKHPVRRLYVKVKAVVSKIWHQIARILKLPIKLLSNFFDGKVCSCLFILFKLCMNPITWNLAFFIG